MKSYPLFAFSCLACLFISYRVHAAETFYVVVPKPPPITAQTNVVAARGGTWHWRRGATAPQADWRTVADAGLDGTWVTAPGGFGYGDNAINGEATRVNPGMLNVHSTLYIRRTITLAQGADPNSRLLLSVDYDDGFVAYLDGVELTRRNVPGAANTEVANTATTGGVSHEASCCNNPNPVAVIDLGLVGSRLSAGNHVLAVIGVNQEIDSSDFHLIVDLATVQITGGTNTLAVVDNGIYALASTNTVELTGVNTMAGSPRVTVNGDDATFDPMSGGWSRAQNLSPGFNRFYLAAHNAFGGIITNLTLDVVYVVGITQVSGVIGDATWNDPSLVVHVASDLVVQANATLVVGPGQIVMLAPATSITAGTNGTLLAQGTEEQPAVFLPATTNAWGGLVANGSGAALNLFYSDVVSGQIRSLNRGTIVMEDSIVRDLPDLGREVIECVNGSGLTLRRCYMTRFAEGDSVDTPVLVEDSLLEGFLVDGMDIKATNSPLIVRRTTLRDADPNNSNADAVDFGPGAGTIDSCLIHGFPDKGVSIGGASGTVIRNSLIFDCGIGISAYASTGLILENTTVTRCGTGIFFRNNPTPGIGDALNMIVWDNTLNLVLSNASMLHFSYSDVAGTNVPGPGNISLAPLFVDPAQNDFRLQPASPAAGTADDGGDMGARLPVGGIPSAPARLIALKQPDSSVSVRWQDTSDNELGVAMERSVDQQTWAPIGQAGDNSLSFTDAAPPGGSVYYRARATNDVGVSAWSNPARATIVMQPMLQIGRLDASHVLLSFAAEAGAAYTVQSRSNWTAGSWTNWLTFSSLPSGTTHYITNEVAGEEAYFRLVSE